MREMDTFLDPIRHFQDFELMQTSLSLPLSLQDGMPGKAQCAIMQV